jgi:hypothetical protein
VLMGFYKCVSIDFRQRVRKEKWVRESRVPGFPANIGHSIKISTTLRAKLFRLSIEC